MRDFIDDVVLWLWDNVPAVLIVCAVVVLVLSSLASCTGPQLRATLASIEVGYAQTRSDADVGGHVGTPSLTGDAFRGDVDSEAWTSWVSFHPFQGLYMPEQEILEHIRPPPPRERCGDVCPTCKKGLD